MSAFVKAGRKLDGLIIMGFGGHARSVADVALSCGIKNLVFIENNAREGECFLEFPVVKKYKKQIPSGWRIFPAAGNNEERQEQFRVVAQNDWEMATVISPYATIGVNSKIGLGSFIANNAHVGPEVEIGDGCILNSGSVVEHETKISDYSHISINATIAGRCCIGQNVMIGAGATVIDKLHLCDDVVVGAGGVVVENIITSGVYVGVPVHKVH